MIANLNDLRNCALRRYGVPIILMGCLVLGCSPRTDTHGDPLVADRISQIVPGVHTKDSVSAILGSPSTTSPFDGESWYYISARTETLAFLEREETDRQVIVVRFNDYGVVRQVDTFGKERGHEVRLVERETPTFGTELSLVQEFLGNLGRFNKEETEGGQRR